MEWNHGMAWHGVAWRGVAWHGMAWHGMDVCMYVNFVQAGVAPNHVVCHPAGPVPCMVCPHLGSPGLQVFTSMINAYAESGEIDSARVGSFALCRAWQDLLPLVMDQFLHFSSQIFCFNCIPPRLGFAKRRSFAPSICCGGLYTQLHISLKGAKKGGSIS